jgi:hypothetical protein
MNDQKPTALDRLAARCAADPFFLASALAAYQQRHALGDAGLAAVLGCPVAMLTQLRLCRRPGAATPGRTIEEDVATIAQRFGVDATALRRVVDEALAG